MLRLYVATVPGVLTYTVWNATADHADPARTDTMLPLMPVVTLMISALSLSEALAQTIGMALAVVGVYPQLDLP